MGQKLLGDERADEGNDIDQPADDQDLCQDSGQSQAQAGAIDEEGGINLTEVLSTTVDHFFPRFNEWLKGLTDIRDQDVIVYQRETLIWSGLLSLVSKRGARMAISHDMRVGNFCENLKRLSGQADLERVPHGDTVEYQFMRLNAEEIDGLPGKMIRTMLRGRVLEDSRLLKQYYTIAIDAVHMHSFDYEHCEQCLSREDKVTGRKVWMHIKLQASLVTPDGLCLPVTSEWIENEKDYVKQDCELLAFYRLVKRLRQMFPQLSICVLLDGLYARQSVFDALKDQRMEWIVVFKPGSMSYIYTWVMDIKRVCGKKNLIIQRREEVVAQRCKRNHAERLRRGRPKRQTRCRVTETEYSWMAAVAYTPEPERSLFNIMTCHETVDGQLMCDYVWLVSDALKLGEGTVKELVARGRCRWKIENEGFNTQKNGGYGLEHLYSRDKVSMKVWCALIDVAHIINQLIEKGSLIKLKAFGSVAAIARRIFEDLKFLIFEKPVDPPRIQIRLGCNTS